MLWTPAIDPVLYKLLLCTVLRIICSRAALFQKDRQLQQNIPVQPEDHLTLIVAHSLMWVWLWEAEVSHCNNLEKQKAANTRLQTGACAVWLPDGRRKYD